MNKNKKIVSIVVGIVVLVGTFFIGMSYGKSSTSGIKNINGFSADMQNQIGQFGMNSKNNKNIGGGIANGEIITKDDKSVTIKLTDGGSKIIFFDTSTAITKTATGSANDLTTGIQVSVTGTTNSDGSITAKSIQIRPQIKPNTSAQ